MMTDSVTYQTFWTVFMQDGPSLWSTFRTFRDFVWRRGLRSKPTMVFMILTMIFVLAFPTLASAMTGYSANNQAVVKTDEVKQVLFSQFKSAWYVIHDGNRVNLSDNYAIGSYYDELMVCYFSDCIKSCKHLTSSDQATFLTSLSAIRYFILWGIQASKVLVAWSGFGTPYTQYNVLLGRTKQKTLCI